MLALHGIFPPIPTPFNTDESLALDQLRSNLERWAEWPLAGYVVGGSNGEAVALTAQERVAVIGQVRQAIGSDRLLIAGAGAESTRAAAELAGRMAEAGADAVIVVTPSYYRPMLTSAAFIQHYSRIADASPVPVVLYNVPVYTGLDLPVEAVLELAQHSNVIGIKDSGGSAARITAMVADTPDEFQVLAGSASFLLPALTAGAVGCVPALGCVAGPQVYDVLQAFREGDLAKARTLQARLIAPNAAVTSRFGVAGLKAALDRIGFYGGPVRSPLLGLDETARSELEAVLGELIELP